MVRLRTRKDRFFCFCYYLHSTFELLTYSVGLDICLYFITIVIKYFLYKIIYAFLISVVSKSILTTSCNTQRNHCWLRCHVRNSFNSLIGNINKQKIYLKNVTNNRFFLIRLGIITINLRRYLLKMSMYI